MSYQAVMWETIPSDMTVYRDTVTNKTQIILHIHTVWSVLIVCMKKLQHCLSKICPVKINNNNNKQIPWGIYVPRLIFIWGVKNGKVNQRTTGPVSNT